MEKLLTEVAMTIPCHRLPERSLSIKGKPMMICTRCFAMLIGYTFTPIAVSLSMMVPIWIPIAMAVPLLIDGYTQRWKWRESNNLVRFITGLAFGVGQALFISTLIWMLVHSLG